MKSIYISALLIMVFHIAPSAAVGDDNVTIGKMVHRPGEWFHQWFSVEGAKDNPCDMHVTGAHVKWSIDGAFIDQVEVRIMENNGKKDYQKWTERYFKEHNPFDGTAERIIIDYRIKPGDGNPLDGYSPFILKISYLVGKKSKPGKVIGVFNYVINQEKCEIMNLSNTATFVSKVGAQ